MAHERSGFKPDILVPVLLGLIALGMGLVGLGWGLPSHKRNRLYFHERPPQPPQIPPEAVVQSWKYFPEFSWIPERRSLSDNLSTRTPRSVFNPIRSYQPDEYVILKSISNMEPAKWDFNPKFLAWPHFFIYIVAAVLKLASIVGLVTLSHDLGYYYAHPEAMARLYLVGRFIVCLFGAGAVAAVFFLGKKLGDWRTGALSGVVVLLSPPFIVSQHSMTPDVPMVFFATFALLACVWISEGGHAVSVSPYVLAGLFTGLAMGCKYDAGYLAFAIFFAYMVGEWHARGWRSALAPHGWGRLALAIATAAVTFVLTNPYLIVHVRDLWWVVNREVACVWATCTFPAALLPWHMLICLVGAGALFFAVLGIFAGGRATLALTFTATAIYACSVWTAPQYVHHYLIFLPILAVCGGVALHAMQNAVGLAPRTKKFALITLYTLFVGFVLFPLVNVSASFLTQFTGTNTRDSAGAWLAANIPRGAKLALVAEPWQYTTPPLDTTRYQIILVGYDFEKLEARKPDYLLVSSADFAHPYGLSLPLPQKLEFLACLRLRILRQVAVFERPVEPLCRLLFAPGFTWPEDMLFTNPRIEVYQFNWE